MDKTNYIQDMGALIALVLLMAVIGAINIFSYKRL